MKPKKIKYDPKNMIPPSRGSSASFPQDDFDDVFENMKRVAQFAKECGQEITITYGDVTISVGK